MIQHSSRKLYTGKELTKAHFGPKVEIIQEVVAKFPLNISILGDVERISFTTAFANISGFGIVPNLRIDH